jgi:hypothetical protein
LDAGYPARFAVGTVGSYGIAARNFGPGTAHGVKVVIKFTANLQLSSADPGCVPKTADIVVCKVASIAPGTAVSTSVELLGISAGKARVVADGTEKTPDSGPVGSHLLLKSVLYDAPPG